jgi:hypothetical protein
MRFRKADKDGVLRGCAAGMGDGVQEASKVIADGLRLRPSR